MNRYLTELLIRKVPGILVSIVFPAIRSAALSSTLLSTCVFGLGLAA